ncbi:hypothetical protein HOY80DRAFT_1136436 [Tuber brumale]|nr:hypothetical protein HOY80DRAFT_1136436 [Tuber brumale]
MDQDDQGQEEMKEEMDAPAIELEDLLGLMKPEVFAHFPDLGEEYFDWAEVVDFDSQDLMRHLVRLLGSVEAKLSGNINLDLSDADGRTPPLPTTSDGHMEVVKILVTVTMSGRHIG